MVWHLLPRASFKSPISWILVHHVLPRLIILHHCYRNMKDSDNQLQKCWDTPKKKRPFLLQIAPGHRSLNIILTSLLPPIQSCSSKFWVWSCIASNFDKGWRGGSQAQDHGQTIYAKIRYSVSSTFATGCSHWFTCLACLCLIPPKREK